MDLIKRPVGRPRKNGDVKNCVISFRSNKDLRNTIDNLCERSGKSKADIMKEAVELYDLMLKTKGE